MHWLFIFFLHTPNSQLQSLNKFLFLNIYNLIIYNFQRRSTGRSSCDSLPNGKSNRGPGNFSDFPSDYTSAIPEGGPATDSNHATAASAAAPAA